MAWQDIVLFIGNVFFCFTLLPMIVRRDGKPPLLSSIPTGILLLIFSGTMATLGLWLAAVSQFIVGIEWLILAFQKLREKETVM